MRLESRERIAGEEALTRQNCKASLLSMFGVIDCDTGKVGGADCGHASMDAAARDVVDACEDRKVDHGCRSNSMEKITTGGVLVNEIVAG